MGAVRFLLNGAPVSLTDPDPSLTLLDFLRETKGLTGTKEGCNEGDCGACTVSIASLDGDQINHRALNACILFVPQLHGKSVRTVEGLASPKGKLHPVQQAMVDHHGSQCGFCTPGFVMSLYTAQRDGRQDYDDVLAGNLCRCTGYAPIIRAAEASTNAPRPKWLKDERAALAKLQSGDDVSLNGAYLPADLNAFADWYAAHPDATLIAGATDVGLWVTKGLRDLGPVAFLHRLTALQQIKTDATGLHIGAGVSLSRLRGMMVSRHADFAELLRRFGSVQVRNAGTIGGNIANGSPIGDAAPALIALSAAVHLRRGKVRRSLPLEDFFVAYGKQDRAKGEFVEAIHIPTQPDTLRCFKISKRFDQDISALCGAFNITITEGTIIDARIAFGGMAATPKRASTVEAALIGQPWKPATIRTAQAKFAEDFEPISDMRASAAYRMQVAQNLLMRVFEEARDGTRQTVLEAR